MSILVLQHIGCETIGKIEEALKAAGLEARVIYSAEGQTVPREMGEAAGLIVMGGPMSVYEEERYPFLRDEMRLIEKAVEEEKPVLGICLGSQMLAAALGAQVSKGPQKEIGWYPVRLTPSASEDALLHGVPEWFMGFHWHGDRFNLPVGATPLASSEITPIQAFRYGKNAYGFLFHMEVTDPMIREWVRAFNAELEGIRLDGKSILAGISEHLSPLHTVGKKVFGRWVSLVAMH